MRLERLGQDDPVLEAAIPRLVAQGLRVAVVKHDAHGLAVDHPGKDSDRLFRVGADVALRGPDEALRRTHWSDADDLAATLADLLADHDLVLVEGHKGTPLPKVWLASDGRPDPPPEVAEVRAVLPWDTGRLDAFLAILDDWLAAAWREVPLLGGVLIGGASSRMGRPKHLLEHDGTTFAERAVAALRPHVGDVVLLGSGEVPSSLAGLPAWPIPRTSPGRSPGYWRRCAGRPATPCSSAPATCRSSTRLPRLARGGAAPRPLGSRPVARRGPPGAPSRRVRAAGAPAPRGPRRGRASRPACHRGAPEGGDTHAAGIAGACLHQRQHPRRPRRARSRLKALPRARLAMLAAISDPPPLPATAQGVADGGPDRQRAGRRGLPVRRWRTAS